MQLDLFKEDFGRLSGLVYEETAMPIFAWLGCLAVFRYRGDAANIQFEGGSNECRGGRKRWLPFDGLHQK